MVMPHSLPLTVSFVAGPYIRPLRPVLAYPAWSGAPRVGFDKRQSFKKGLHGWTPVNTGSVPSPISLWSPLRACSRSA
eukprot:scaffold72479_cov62-Phaeocystis_antarctica.AAC.2